MDASGSGIFDAYPTRCLLGLAASISLIIVLVHLPIHPSPQQIGWTPHSSADRIRLSNVAPLEQSKSQETKGSDEAPPATDPSQSSGTEPRRTSDLDARSEGGNSSPGGSESEKGWKNVRFANTLGITDRTPQIVGGKGSLYLNINYPKKAREQGIEGRLVLQFLVQPDGSVTDIEVAKSLHPLCDSAAVEGIRSVEFIPAKHNGDPIPVRLRLPVRFELSDIATATRRPPRTP